jgi:SAM-dependent methyltransferase
MSSPPSRTIRADAGRLASVPESLAPRLRQALAAAGFPPSSPGQREIFERRARGGRNLPRLLRLTAAETPLHTLIRLFSLGAPARLHSAREALAPIPLEDWREAGLVAVDGDRVEALVGLEVFEGLVLALDRPDRLDGGAEPDHVSGVTNSTVSLAAFLERRAFDDILDLGTGGGVLAFLAARAGRRVFATDVNPRAIQFARFNARLNGAANVEFAVGGAFEPARGRRFDLILANPPCVIGPAARYAFSDSGMELDSLCCQIVAGAPDYLKAGGLFQATAQWPNFGRAEWKERVSEWLRGGPCDALALHLEETDAPRYAEQAVGDTAPVDADSQARMYQTYAAYFEDRNVTSISEGLIALRLRADPAVNWVHLEDLGGRRATHFGGAVWEYFAVADALERMGGGLLDARLRVAPSLSVTVSHTWDGRAWEESYHLRQGAGFEFQAGVDWRIANLVRRLDGSRTLREAIAELAAAARAPFNAVAPPCVEIVRQMTQRGLLLLP